MAERFRTVLRTFLVLLALGCVSAKRFSIMAPNVFHIGVNERVSVTVFDAGQPVTVKLYLQDYPHRRKTFSEVQAVLPPQKGSNTFLTVKVEPQDLPDTSSVDKQYVYLVAKSDDAHFQFHKEARILLSYRDGMVFIQTDKPIYTPRQTVKIRVIPVDLDMKPSKGKITVAVMNPHGIRVQQWKDLDTSTGIISKRLDLGSGILQGKWTITTFYGHQDFHKTSVQFEVKEYVLPKFSVKLSVPPYILKTDQYVKVKITASYTYKEPVVGAANIRLSIAGFSSHVVLLATHNVLLDRSGAATITESVNTIRERVGDYWFPEKARLLVQADVIERATGNRESVVDRSCQFISSPYHIDFKNTPKYFKPGFPFVVKVVVTYPNKQPAISVPVKILATGMHGSQQRNLKGVNPHSGDKTNEDGEAEFVVDLYRDCQKVEITVKTDNQTLTVSQNAMANYTANAFHPGNGPMIMLRQLTLGKVDSRMFFETYRSGDSAATLFSYAVISRGQILSHNTIDSFDGVIRTTALRISSDMFPTARLIGYFFDSKEQVVADSILLKIEDKLPTQVDFPDAISTQPNGTRVELNVIEKYPNAYYSIRIKAPQGTRLGLLAVDESVYLLRNENRLSKERILRTAEELDLGCDGGGGKDVQDIFKNAGVVFITNSFMSVGREHYGCDADVSRKKRSLGVDTDFGPSDQEVIEETLLRSYYPETWIYDEITVGPSGLATMYVTIPGTITTWVMQAMAINNKTGLGLATPLRIVSKKDYFISLKMPYSVKRGEQVSLLATVFNNGEQEMRAKIYLKGSYDFCSFAAHDKHALIAMTIIPPNAARSVTVPVLPKRTGKVEVEVSAVFQVKFFTNTYMNAVGDSVRSKLLVEVERGFNETCEFDLNTTVKEIKLRNSGDFADTVKKTSRKRVKGCKGKYKNKKKCRRKEKKEEKDNVQSINLKVCTRKKIQVKAEEKAIMDIGILNGFTPERTSVQKLTLNNAVDKIEVLDTSLVIYFKKIPSDRELCVNVTFEQVDFVGAVQAVPVNVYDYYEPDPSCSVFYGPTSSLLRLGICDPGSSSCKCSEVPSEIGCVELLRNLLKNPPRYTHVAINVRLSKARYRCRAGYVLSGNELRTCKGGRWSEDKEPKCMGPCRRPKQIPHATFIGSSFKFKDKLRYICNKDYTLKGPSIRRCGEYGRWSKAPTCFKDYSPCGESPADTRSLLGGRKIMSKRGWWPWQIAIYRISIRQGNVKEALLCGGALISRQWVLTAAHCFYQRRFGRWRADTSPSEYVIKAGVHNSTEKENSEQKMAVEEIFVHENFDITTYSNNIALAKLDRPVKLTNFVRSVCLQEKSEQDLAIPETYGMATGWGVTKALRIGELANVKDVPNVLHHSFLKIQNDQYCSKSSMPYSINTTVTFCAADEQKRSGTCIGDGGGAFVREMQRGYDKHWAWVATGIVSWGKGCAQKDDPGYYTRVYPFIDWIKKTMDEN